MCRLNGWIVQKLESDFCVCVNCFMLNKANGTIMSSECISRDKADRCMAKIHVPHVNYDTRDAHCKYDCIAAKCLASKNVVHSFFLQALFANLISNIPVINSMAIKF